MEKILFHEKQYFRQPAVWILVALTDLIVLYSLVYILWLDPDKEEIAAAWAVAGSLLLCLIMTVMFLKTALETFVRADGIYFRFTLFQKKIRHLPPGEVIRWEIRDVKPVLEFGGYGYRKNKKGTAYLVSGGKAVFFTLSDGKKIVIGTSKPAMLSTALSQIAVHSGQLST